MFDRLLEFVEVDDEAKALASRLCDLLAPHLPDVIDDFYAKVTHFNINSYVTPETVANLKRRQKQHWMALLRSRFDEEYLESTRRIGVRHRDIGLSPMWYVAGYMRLKLAFVEIIIKSELPAVTKGQLVKTLDRYIAIDMALALSTYEAIVLD